MVNKQARRIGMIDLEDGEFVILMATDGVSLEDALYWADDLIATQRRIMAKRKKPEADPPMNDTPPGEN